jgi:hypothetical protein
MSDVEACIADESSIADEKSGWKSGNFSAGTIVTATRFSGTELPSQKAKRPTRQQLKTCSQLPQKPSFRKRRQYDNKLCS